VNNLTKTEYQILTKFYQINEIMTKSEFVEKNPELNPNTIVMGIRHLYKKGYLEVAKICQTRTNLTRAYRPKLSVKCFYDEIFGPEIFEKLIAKIVAETEDASLLDSLLEKVQRSKEKMAR
jgi:predicted transcriptional regulator